jgi:transcriptional regulator with XRE-family HTH domain
MKINPTTISRWKSGHHAPELDKIDKLAEILNINPLEFYRTNEAPAEPVSKTLIKMSAIPDKIYDIAPDIGKDHKIWKDVLDILKGAKEDTPKSKAASKA